MFQLKPGLHHFPPAAFGSTRELLHPDRVRDRDTMMIACSGQGTAPDNVSFAEPGRIFVLQHLGASMPSQGDCERDNGLSCDDLKRTFDKYDFRHIIVCSHLKCRVIRHWLKPITNERSNLGGPRQRFEAEARNLVDKHYSPQSVSERCTLMICEHVLCQIENLLSHSFIQERVKADRTSFHGWVIDDESARVFGYHCEDSAFSRI